MKLAILAALAISTSVAVAPLKEAKSPDDGAVVKVQLTGGHGSAVHIGGGFYLTAAHVTQGNPEVELKSEGGETATAEVLWQAKKYDIALMRADIPGVGVAPLECRRPAKGEALEFRGNPLNLEHVSTWGRVSGSVQTFEGFWHKAVPVNAAVIPGMSGGAAIDEDGDLVGINVGTMIMAVGFAGGPAGIGYIVPGDVICDLMGWVS